MKKNILSLIVGAALVLPTMAIAAPANNSDLVPADMRSTAVDNTLRAEIKGPDGELLATQPGAVDIDESDADDMDDETDDMMRNKANNNAASTNNAQITTNVAATTTTPAPARSAQTPNMQHSNANYQPLIAGEAASNNKMADTASTLKEKKKDKRGELLATQPANVQFKENRRIAVSR